MTGQVIVRRAVADDAEIIADIHVLAWRQTYRHLVSPELLDAIDPADRVERWRGIITGSDQDAWVAELNGVTVAWATTSARDPAQNPRGLEVNGMYALASAHGSGVGQALLDAATGDAAAFLWVAADNPRAQAFYRRNGFIPDGESSHSEILGTAVHTVRWIR